MDNKVAFIVVLTLAIYLGGYAVADERSLNVRYVEAKGTRISGSTDPDSVPYQIKYRVFLRHYQQLFGPAIVQDINHGDNAILTEAASSLDYFELSDQAKIDHEFVELCSRRASMSAEAVARKVDQIYAKSAARHESHFKEIMSRLSESARTKVIDFVDNEVASRINAVIPQSRFDFLKEDADEFDYWIESECHRALTGDYPAELKARMEQFRRQFETNNNN